MFKEYRDKHKTVYLVHLDVRSEIAVFELAGHGVFARNIIITSLFL